MQYIFDLLSKNDLVHDLTITLLTVSLSAGITSIIRNNKLLNNIIRQASLQYKEQRNDLLRSSGIDLIYKIFDSGYKLAEKIKIIMRESEEAKEEKMISPSIIGLFAIKRSQRNLYASGVILLTLIVHESITYFSTESLLNLPTLYLVSLVIIIALDEYILTYRVKKGLFGTNKEEAKEIINFIIKNSAENNNFNGPEGKIKIFNEILEGKTDTEKGFDADLNPSFS